MASGHYEYRRAVIGEDQYGRPIWGSQRVWVPDPAPAPAPAPVAKPPAVPRVPVADSGAAAEAARRAREQREALEERARQLALRELGLRRDQRRRETEASLAERRRAAYDALRERTGALVSPDSNAANLRREQQAAELARTSAAYAEATRREQSRRRSGLLETADESESEASRERRRRLAQARQTGDYVAVVEYVRAQQEATGGRYLDRKLLDAAMAEFGALRDAAQTRFEGLLDQLYEYEKTSDYTQLVTLYESADFQSALADYVRLFGDGRSEGVAQRFAAVQNAVADANDRYLERAILGAHFGGGILTESELEARQAELRQQLIRRGRGQGGAQEFAEDQHRISMSEFLRQAEVAERAKMTEQYARYQNAIRLSRQEGMLTEGGEVSNIPLARLQERDRLVETWRAGGLSERELTQLVGQLQGSFGVDRDQALRELWNRALRGFRTRWRSEFDVGVLSGRQPTSSERLYLAAESDFKRQLWRFLTGQERKGDITDALSELTMQPIAGDLLRVLAMPVGLVGAGLRGLTSSLFGGAQLRTPDVNFFNPNEPLFQLQDAEGGQLLGGFGPLGPGLGLDVSATTREASASALAELEGVFAAGDLGRSLQALSNYGFEWAGGNTAGLISTIFDPLTYTGVGNFLRAGRLSVARAGGLRAALTSPSLAADDFLRLSMPRALGGLDRATVREAWNRFELARQLNVPYEQVRNMSAEELRARILETIGRTPQQIKRLPGWARLFREDPVNAQQILNASLEQAREIAAHRGARVVNVLDLESSVNRAREAAARLERRAEAQVRKEAALAAEEAAAKALERARREIGRQRARAGVVPPHVPVRASNVQRQVPARVIAQRKALERELAAVESESLTVARRISEVTDVLRTSRDRTARQQAYGELRPLMERLDKLEGLGWAPKPPGAPLPKVGVRGQNRRARARGLADALAAQRGPKGIVADRRERLQEFLTAQGLPTGPARFLGVTAQGVAADGAWITAQIGAARRRLRGQLTPTQRVWWERRVEMLVAAQDYLGIEERLLRGASRVQKSAWARFRETVAPTFAPGRFSPRALTFEAGVEDLGRDIHRMLRRAKVEGPAGTERPFREVMASVPILQRQRFVPDDAVRAAVGDLLDDVDLFTAARVLDDAVRQPAGYGLYWDAAQVAYRQVARVLSRGGGRVDTLMAHRFLRRVGEARPHAPLTRQSYLAANRQVTRAIQQARKYQVRFTERAPTSVAGQRRLGAVPDWDPKVILAKVRALDNLGIHQQAYEETRRVFEPMHRRFVRGQTLRNDAAAEVKRSGRAYDEVFDELRETRRTDEAVSALGEMAAEYPHLTDGEVVNLFTELHIHRDLVDSEVAISPFMRDTLEGMFREVSGVEMADASSFLTRHNAPPMTSKAEATQWLTDHGQWAPRTADDVRAGARSWSIAEQRAYWEGAYGVTPGWLDEAELARVVHDPAALAEFNRRWGTFTDDFEQIVSFQGVEPRLVANEIVWGGEGIKRARTFDEVRRWAIETYGPLVSRDGKTLHAMPQLMDPRKPEYRAWIAARVRHGYENPGLAHAFPYEFDPSLIRLEQIQAFGDAVFAATQRRISRAIKAGDVAAGEDWLPQEQLLFAYEVTNDLLLDPKWRSFMRARPPGLRVLGAIGSFFRLPMVWTPAFPIMNLIDAFGLKRGLLSLLENRGRMVGRVRPSTVERIPDMAAVGAERKATWYLRGASGRELLMDSALEASMRARGAVKMVADLPLTVSKWGEDRLRLDFARSMYEQLYDDLIAAGVEAVEADIRAIAHANHMVGAFFPSLETAGEFVKALNQLVPFFTYNLRNSLISLKLIGQNPWVLLVADRLGQYIEDQNRARWEAENPGVPFPVDGNERKIQVEINGITYTIDLSTYSDWSRGADLLFESHAPDDWVYEFFRAPHPSQAIFFAWAFGFNEGKTPWGTPVRWEDLTLWADFSSWLMAGGQAAFDPNDPRSKDTIQILSQMLFFKGFGRVSPIKAKVQVFFGFMAIDEDRAWDYYRDNPDLRAFFMLDGADWRPELDASTRLPSWFRHRSDEEVAGFEAALAGYEQLKATFDARIAQYYLRPWDPAYRALLKERRETLALYLGANPVLADVWGFYRTHEEWATEFDSWKTDELVDRYFELDKLMPQEKGYANEVEYLKALDAFYDAKRRFLEAHPDVYDRLHFSHNAVERAWFDHELMWSEALDRVAGVRIKIAEEEARPTPNRELIDLLYNLSEASYLRLNAESFGDFYDLIDAYRGEGGLVPRIDVPSLIDRALGRVRNAVVFPGRADFLFERASPDERRQIEANEAYVREIKAFVQGLKDPRLFWVELARRPALLKAYLERHPEREVDYRYSVAIGAIVQSATSGQDFFRRLEADPWLMAEYFRRHPDKAAAYQAGREYFDWISRWIETIKAGNSAQAQAVWDRMPAWVHDRYFAKHPDSGMASVDGVSYFAAISGWVDLLKAKKYDEADEYFRALPGWVQERYFDKHPDQRAKHDLESSVLRAGAEYFLAAPGDKAAILERYPQLAGWLNRWSGNEAAMRGLVFAIYRAIPSSEPWLKRTFRERYPEIFGVEAQGQRRLAKVAAMLVANPEMAPFYQRALAVNSRAFEAQLRRGGTPPKPLEVDRRRRLAKRRRKRAARLARHWRLHKDLRR